MTTRTTHVAVRAAGIALVVLLVAEIPLRADEFQVNYNGGESVSVTYTNPRYPGHKQSPTVTTTTIAESFSVKDTSVHPQTTFTAFCVDLYHQQWNHATTTAPESKLSSLSSATLSSAFPYTSYSTAGLVSRMDYFGYVYNTLASAGIASDKEVAGALQLVLWSLTDKNFHYSSKDAVLNHDVGLLTGLLGGAGGSLTFELTGYNQWKGSSKKLAVSITGYATNGSAPSASGELILVHGTPQGSGKSQNLLTWGRTLTPQSLSPEPSSFALASLGALAFAGYALRRQAKV